jgi:hypothetical protein
VNFFNLPTKKQTANSFLNNQCHRERLGYLLETPTAMLHLVTKGLFPPYLCTILSQPPETLKKLGFSVESKDPLLLFAYCCTVIEEALKTYAENSQDQLFNEVSEFVSLWSQQKTGIHLMNIIQFFSLHLRHEITSLEQWNEFKAEVNKYLDFLVCLVDFGSYAKDESEVVTFRPKVNQFFENLSPDMKKQAVGHLKASVVGGELSPWKKKVMADLSEDFSKRLA